MPPDARGLPPLFLERLRAVVPTGRYDAVLRTFAQPKPTTLRVNTLKSSAPEVWERLTAAGFLLERVPWCREALILRRGRLRELQETDDYRTGAIYVQGLSSLLPPLVLDPQPGETILDLAAAPGSKTTQMAARMQGRGRIVAVDNNRVRCYKLQANVAQQGAAIVEVVLADGAVFGRRHAGAFDRVLVDAPCSVEGRFLASEPSSYRFWKPAKIHEMVRTQRRLLRAGIEALRPGGMLVYSTCTFAPEENEAVVDWALAQAGETAGLEPITLELPNAAAGLTRWEERTFHPSLARARRIIPTDQLEGFFIARLRKKAAVSEGEGNFP